MATMGPEESALELSPFYKVTDISSKRDTRNRIFSYKFGLVVLDLIMVQLSFGLGGLVVDSSFYLRGNLNQAVLLFVLSLVVLAFFPAFDLYSYHVIFLRKNHLANQIKSFYLKKHNFRLKCSKNVLKLPHLFPCVKCDSFILSFIVVMRMMLLEM